MKKILGWMTILCAFAVTSCVIFDEEEKNYYGDKVDEITAYAATYPDSTVYYRDLAPYRFYRRTKDMNVRFDNRGIAERAFLYQWNTYQGFTFKYFIGAFWSSPFYYYPGYYYGGMGFLHVQEEDQGKGFPPAASAVIENTAFGQIALPPDTLMGCSVERKLFVPHVGTNEDQTDFIRWLEILTNNTEEEKTVDVVVGGNVKGFPIIKATSDKDLVPEAGEDGWILTRSPGYPDYTYFGGWVSTYITTWSSCWTTCMTTYSCWYTCSWWGHWTSYYYRALYVYGQYPYVAHLFDGTMGNEKVDTISMLTTSGDTNFDFFKKGTYDVNTATKTADTGDVILNWRDIKLKPGERKVIMHFEILSMMDYDFYTLDTDFATLDAAIETADYVQGVPHLSVSGMSKEDINAVANFPAARYNCNVQGIAGAVDPGALVEARNKRTDETQKSYALPDGSFGICIDALEGDRIEIEADGVEIDTVTAE